MKASILFITPNGMPNTGGVTVWTSGSETGMSVLSVRQYSFLTKTQASGFWTRKILINFKSSTSKSF